MIMYEEPGKVSVIFSTVAGVTLDERIKVL
jgi:hypothetical protein